MTLRSVLLSLTALSLLSIAACAAPSSSSPSSSDDEESQASISEELKKKTDASIKAEIEAAAEGANYTSESDYPFTLVSASLDDGQKTITEEIVREKLAWYVDHDESADKPLATLNASVHTWADWKSDYANCQEDEAPSPDDCAKVQTMNAAIERNLRGIKVFYFGANGSPGHVDGTAVSVIIVGRTPKGNLVGVRTIAIWT